MIKSGDLRLILSTTQYISNARGVQKLFFFPPTTEFVYHVRTGAAAVAPPGTFIRKTPPSAGRPRSLHCKPSLRLPLFQLPRAKVWRGPGSPPPPAPVKPAVAAASILRRRAKDNTRQKKTAVGSFCSSSASCSRVLLFPRAQQGSFMLSPSLSEVFVAGQCCGAEAQKKRKEKENTTLSRGSWVKKGPAADGGPHGDRQGLDVCRVSQK